MRNTCIGHRHTDMHTISPLRWRYVCWCESKQKFTRLLHLSTSSRSLYSDPDCFVVDAKVQKKTIYISKAIYVMWQKKKQSNRVCMDKTNFFAQSHVIAQIECYECNTIVKCIAILNLFYTFTYGKVWYQHWTIAIVFHTWNADAEL